MMGKITLRGLRAHPVRFIATMAAVIFGTAFLSGALVLKESVSTTFEANTTAALRNVDIAVQPDLEKARQAFIQNPTIPASLLDTVRDVAGVRAAAGVLSGQMSVVGADDNVVKPKGMGSLRIADDELNPYTLQSGRWPDQPGEVAIDTITAEERGIALDASIPVATTTGRQMAKVVGTVSYLTLVRSGDGPNFVVGEADAFAWLGAGEMQYKAILVAVTDTPPPSADPLTALRAVMDTRAVVVTGDQYRDQEAGAAAGLANVLGTGLTVFAYVALFICVFIIYNTFTTVVAQRTRELALLRAIGASGRQVRRAVLLEALVVALSASASGLLLGIGLALLLAKAAPGLVSAGSGQQVNLAVSVGIILQVMISGTVITMVSAYLPARRSARVKPIEALRTSAVDRSATSRARARIGLGLTALGAASLVLAVVVKQAVLLLPGPGLLFFGLLFAGPWVAARFASLAARAVGARTHITSRLASDNLRRNPRRAATTGNALVIGVFLVVFVTAAGGALRDFSIDLISKFGGADLNVASENSGALPAGLSDRIAAVPGVRDQVAVYANFGRAVPAQDSTGGQMEAPPSAIELAKAESALGLKVKKGKPFAEIGPGEAAFMDYGALFGAGGGGGASGIPGLGDEMTVTFGNGAVRNYKIVTLTDVSVSLPPLVISTADARSVDPDIEISQFSLSTEDGQTAAVKDALDRLSNEYSNVIVYEGSFIVTFLKTFFNGLISAVNALLGAAVVVAIFGIVNTLILAITERTQEIGLLRAVGMTRQQLRSTIRTEAVLVSLMGTLLGVVSGLFVAFCVASSLLEGSGTGFAWPVSQMLLIVGAGIFVGVAASVIPAQRATKLDILASINSE